MMNLLPLISQEVRIDSNLVFHTILNLNFKKRRFLPPFFVKLKNMINNKEIPELCFLAIQEGDSQSIADLKYALETHGFFLLLIMAYQPNLQINAMNYQKNSLI